MSKKIILAVSAFLLSCVAATAQSNGRSYSVGGSNGRNYQNYGSGTSDGRTYTTGLCGIPVNPNLVGCWSLNGTPNDGSASSINGSWVGSQTGNVSTFYSTGYNQSLAGTFDGSTNYINLDSTATLDNGGTISAAAWIKTSGTSGEAILARYKNTGTELGFELSVNNTTAHHADWRVYNTGGTNNAADSTVTVNDGNWHCVVGVFTGTNDLIYVDQNAAVSESYTGTYSTTSGITTRIGSRSNNNNKFTGLIEDVHFYNIALTAGQASTFCAGGNP